MNRLYMIRLENGNSALVQARCEEQALQRAGLRSDPAKTAAQMEEQDIAQVHLAMAEAGVGPQNFTIRELSSFFALAILTDEGNFRFSLDTEAGADEFYMDYPYLDAAAEQEARMDPSKASLENPQVQTMFSQAVAEERTRLLLATDPAPSSE